MGKIICFFGSIGRCGTSQISLSLALRIHERYKDKRVLLIHAEEAAGDDYVKHIGICAEDIRPLLIGRLWDKSEITAKAGTDIGIGIIGGAGLPGSADTYHPDDVKAFLKDISLDYDYVLCDCGSDIAHGLSLGALSSADDRIMVICQSESSLHRFEWIRPYLEKLDLSADAYVLNKWEELSPFDDSYVKTRLGIDKVVRIRKSEKSGEAELKKIPLIKYKSRQFSDDIDEFVSFLNNEL